jgi:hypothetical protein
MIYWDPTSEDMKEWKPVGGWNKQFSDQDKIHATHLFFFFKNKKGFKDIEAEMLAHMVVFKDKYKGMKYSEDQEKSILSALYPIIH